MSSRDSHPDGVLPPPLVTTMSEVTPEQVEWLWPRRFPLGKLVVIDGDPAAGKSTLTLDLAARVSTGATWPDGAESLGPRGVLLLSAEDGIADTLAPRLAAAGADQSRVHVLRAVPVWNAEGTGHEWAFPSLARDVPQLGALLARFDVALCVVDVLFAYLGARVNSHNDAEIRQLLAPLANVAERHRATIVLIRHMTKSTGGSALYRGGGSIGIVGAARAAYLLGRDPNEPDRRILAVTKSNLGQEPPALAYRLVPATEWGCARVEWEAEPLDGVSAAYLLREPADEVEASEANTAEAWLLDFLADRGGEAATKELKAACHGAGLEWNTTRKRLPRIARPFRTGFGATFQAGWKLN